MLAPDFRALVKWNAAANQFELVPPLPLVTVSRRRHRKKKRAVSRSARARSQVPGFVDGAMDARGVPARE